MCADAGMNCSTHTPYDPNNGVVAVPPMSRFDYMYM